MTFKHINVSDKLVNSVEFMQKGPQVINFLNPGTACKSKCIVFLVSFLLGTHCAPRAHITTTSAEGELIITLISVCGYKSGDPLHSVTV